jgi:glyoxylase-like metal-dependent hydrolase (beta-lactamase superfamily II)
MPEGSCAFPVGTIRCTVLSDGYRSYPAEWFFSNADPLRLRQALARYRLPQETILSPYGCMLIETGRHVILCDTGAGPGAATTGAIVARLEMAGIRPRDVDTVVLSHAHPDHIGGTLTAAGQPTFPNARHILAEAEYEFWTGGPSRLRAMNVPDQFRSEALALAPGILHGIRHHLELIGGETAIAPGITAIPAPGHTPGHLAILVASGDDALLNIGDAVLHPAHLEEPGWRNALDLAAEEAARTRQTLLQRAAAGNMRVMGFHFPFPCVGRITALPEGGWHWEPGW